MVDEVKYLHSALEDKTLIKFSVVGAIGLAVEISCVAFFYEFFQLSALLSKALAFPVAVLVTWMLNRSLTFRKRKSGDLFKELFRYLNVTLIGALVNNGAYILIIKLFDDELFTAMFAVAVGSLSGLAANYFGVNRYVFVQKISEE